MSFAEHTDESRTGGVRGVAVAVVTKNDDPKRMGRVKVTYPWRDAEDESHWARLAVPMAGPDRGTYFLPDVGDEVAVGFQGDDIHHPIVVGCLWNGVDEAPERNADGENDVKTVRSRAGHEVTLDDDETGGGVSVTTGGGHRVSLDDAAGGERIEVSHATNESAVVLDADGSVSITGAAGVSVEAPSIDVKGRGSVNIEADGVLTLKGAIININ